ncbi:MAG: energy-coupling factor ABC transporter ATP-binding protein [Deltaproteobacteria bacterium]|jgi:tungstate transport system ATP-binding protein|nr:energy-coupling factor ABC transporter ATP-binding protein [Deltaproteobacteria bacterium]
MSESLYHLEKVTQVYSGRTVLDVESLDIEAQSITGLIGPNGSGKSTLMRILAFLENPASGRASFQDQPLAKVTLEQRRQVAMLNQEPYLLKRSVRGNISYGLKIRGISDTSTPVNRALSKVGLDPDKFSQRSWRELSGGEAQRVALAARLVLKPKVLLLDEPTASVDLENSELILRAALDARDQWGTTLIIISHQLTWLRQIADRILSMDYGKLSLVQ